MWIYIRTESMLWTVGFYDPKGEFQPDSDHSDPEKAAQRVHYLNGGKNKDEIKRIIGEIDHDKILQNELDNALASNYDTSEWCGE